MQTFFKRLLHLIENQGFKNVNDFALNGLKYESSSKLNRLKDESKSPSVEILLDIANKFVKVNLHWLLTGIGNKYLDDTILTKNHEVNEPNANNYKGLQRDKEKIIHLLEEQVRELRKDKEQLYNIIKTQKQ